MLIHNQFHFLSVWTPWSQVSWPLTFFPQDMRSLLHSDADWYAAVDPQAGFCLLGRLCLRQAWWCRPVIPSTQVTETLFLNTERVLGPSSAVSMHKTREQWRRKTLAYTSASLKNLHNLARQKYRFPCVNPPERSVCLPQTVLHSSTPVHAQCLRSTWRTLFTFVLVHCSHLLGHLRLIFSFCSCVWGLSSLSEIWLPVSLL